MKKILTTWNYFTEKQQKALLILSLFQNNFYYDYNGIQDYLIPLKNFHQMDSDPTVDFYPLLRKGMEVGIFQKANGDIAYINSHPLLRFFLQKKKSSMFLDQQIQKHFNAYYEDITKDLWSRLNSGKSEYYNEALEVLNYEHPNILEMLWCSIDAGEDFFMYTSLLHSYYIHHQRPIDWLLLCLHLKKRIAASSKNVNLISFITLLDSIGNAYLNLDNPKKAEFFFLEALKLCEKKNTPNVELEILKNSLYNNIGNCQFDNSKRIKWYTKAYQFELRKKESRRLGSIAFNLSDSFFNLRNLEKSKYYLNIAIKFFNNKNDLHGQIKAYRNLSSHYQIMNEYGKMEENLNYALTIAKNLKGEFQTGIILEELAGVYFLKKEFEKAKAFCKEAIVYFIKSDSIKQQANVFNLLCVIAFEKQELEDGITYAEKALTLYNQSGEYSQMAQTYSNIALKLYELELYKECIPEIEKAIFLYEKVGSKYNLERCRRLLASALWSINTFDRGKAELLKALKYFVDINDSIEIGYCENLAKLFLEQTEDQEFEQNIRNLII